jgi:hypothetical protein
MSNPVSAITSTVFKHPFQIIRLLFYSGFGFPMLDFNLHVSEMDYLC